MFVLTVEARTAQRDALRQHVLAWPATVGSSAPGWLGNTAGVSAGGEVVLLMRFVSQEAAWLTCDLPSYGLWWARCRPLLDAPPVFDESTAVTGILAGGSDRAAAVRITRGSATSERLGESLRQLESLAVVERAPVIGGFVAWHEGGRFTEALYLSSPVERSRQLTTTSSSLRRILDSHDAAVGPGRVIDLEEPWLTSPARPQIREVG